jgi:predicted MFS family arabinose efflux permease
MTDKKMNRLRRWLIMACLCLSGGIIFMIPFLHEVYYIPLQKALDITNTQLALMISVFGFASLLTYFPGGWLADRISARKLITLAMLLSGFSGLYFASFPSFPVSVALHGFWGVACSLVFWSAMIKATRNWAPRGEQGRAFGILESGRGIAEMASSTAFLAVFAWLGSEKFGLSWVIILFSVLEIQIGIMAWFVLEDKIRGNSESQKQKIGWKQVVTVLRLPTVWLISIVILAAYSSYWGSYSFTPYATDVFLMSVVFGGVIGVGKMWLKPLAALGAGFLADRAGISKTVSWSFVVLIVSFGIFVFTPGRPDLVTLLIVNTAVASSAVFALRGIYYALLEEGDIPLAVTGTAAGIASVAGFTPDVFMPLLRGVLLDKYPGGEGYKYFFAVIVILCACGLLASVAIGRRKRKSENSKTDPEADRKGGAK